MTYSVGAYALSLHNLVWNAVRDPDFAADPNALLLAANDTLDTLHSGDPVLVPLLRSLSLAAAEWAVFRTDKHHKVMCSRAAEFYEAFDVIHVA